MAHSKLAVEKSVPLISGLIGDPANQMSGSLYLGMSSNINDIGHQVKDYETFYLRHSNWRQHME